MKKNGKKAGKSGGSRKRSPLKDLSAKNASGVKGAAGSTSSKTFYEWQK
jgi:hypothetical protein